MMMTRPRRSFQALLGIAVLALPAAAATRLTYDINGKNRPIAWSQPSISWSASPSLGNQQETLRRSFATWSSIPGSGLDFTEASMVDARPGRDGVNLVTLADHLFENSGFLAFTTAWFDDDGRVEEADIQIDREAAGEALEQLLTHEIGHMAGLDHSAVVGSAMFPFVATDRPLNLDSDDTIAIRSVYPASSAKPGSGMIRGTVRSSSSPIWGAHVVAIDQRGRTVATTLSNPDGTFQITPLAAGRYSVYAEPLDGPVSRTNFSGSWLRAGGTGFTTRFEPAEIQLGAGQSSDLSIVVAAVPSQLNPRWIGAFDAGAQQLSLDSMAATVGPGDEINIAIGGDGFQQGATTFEIPSSDLQRVSEFTWGPSWVWARYRISPSAEPASLSVVVTSNGEKAALTGAIRIQSPDGTPSDAPTTSRRRATSRPG